MYSGASQYQKDIHEGKVVKITKNVPSGGGKTKLALDVQEMKNIFYKYGDHPVAIQTVSGPFRSGKSFLNNLLACYLNGLVNSQNRSSSVDPNLGPLDEPITKVFDFKSGQVAHTKGIHMFDKPFIVDCIHNGRRTKVALFLVDSQGLFDIESSERDVTILGTLNFLFSSRQIFNVKERIDKVHLDYIFKFAEKVREIKSKNHEKTSPFQSGSLMFLVRDWDEDEDHEEHYPYGFNGGKKYFEITTKPNSKKAIEHLMMQKHFKEAFGDITCFLMPEPGKAVRKKDVLLQNLDQDFLQNMLELFKVLTDPNNIVIKKIGGRDQTCRSLCDYMETVAAAIDSDESLESAESIIMMIQKDISERLKIDVLSLQTKSWGKFSGSTLRNCAKPNTIVFAEILHRMQTNDNAASNETNLN